MDPWPAPRGCHVPQHVRTMSCLQLEAGRASLEAHDDPLDDDRVDLHAPTRPCERCAHTAHEVGILQQGELAVDGHGGRPPRCAISWAVSDPLERVARICRHAPSKSASKSMREASASDPDEGGGERAHLRVRRTRRARRGGLRGRGARVGPGPLLHDLRLDLVHQIAHTRQLKRLRDEVRHTQTQRFDGHLLRAEAGDEDDLHMRVLILHALEELQPAHTGHVEIGDDEGRRCALHLRERLDRAAETMHLASGIRERTPASRRSTHHRPARTG